MKIGLYDMAIEVTRRCNMHCAHCLRGNAQNMNITRNIIEDALRDVEWIGALTLTGGEPSLNVLGMLNVLDVCKQNNIQVGSIKDISDDFLVAMVKWYAYCAECSNFEREMCGLALSEDMFHDDISDESVAKLQAFSFFREEDKKTDWGVVSLINEGRAVELGDFERREIDYDFDFPVDVYHNDDGEDEIIVNNDSIVYLSANGDIKTNCDIAYDNNYLTIGNVCTEDLRTILLRRAAEDEDD